LPAAGLHRIADRAGHSDRRYFSGGGTIVVSLSANRLESLSGDPLGGEFFTIFNAEMTFPFRRAVLCNPDSNLHLRRHRPQRSLPSVFWLRYKLPINCCV
jgi:hypothetical protein